jgi:hypothetical protein
MGERRFVVARKPKEDTMAKAARTNPAAPAVDVAAMSQQGLAQFARTSELMMTGFMSASLRQLEFGQQLMRGNLEDFQQLAQARTPEAFVEVEFDVLRRRSERMAAMVQQLSEDLGQVWANTFEVEPAPSDPPPA